MQTDNYADTALGDQFVEYQKIVQFWLQQMLKIRRMQKAKKFDASVINNFFEKRSPEIARQQREIERFFALAARIISVAIPNLTPSGRNPGYVTRGALNIPFFLIGNLPPNDWLDTIARYANALTVFPDSSMNLSGSLSIFGSITHVNDLDFCEYFSDAADTEALTAFLQRQRKDESPVCCQINIIPTVVMMRSTGDFPNGDLVDRIARTFFAAKFRKLDFIHVDPVLSVTEITNVLIPRAIYLGAPYQIVGTYSQQELVVGQHAWIPATLCNPVVLGSYAAYLAEHALH
jgi:hypothetical protein